MYPLLADLSLDIVAINHGIDDTVTVKYSNDDELFELTIMYDDIHHNTYFELHDTAFYLEMFMTV